MEHSTEQHNQSTLDEVNHVRGAIEAILFVNEKPVTLDQIKSVIDNVNTGEIKKILEEMKEEFDRRKNGMTIVEIAGGYQMLTNSIYVSYVREFYKTKHKEKLSKPALEALAIVAYKQPVTRADIESIRGVNSDGVAVHLIEKELIKIVGRKDVPGRPYLYGTTKQFLEYFGLKSLNDLPTLEEFPGLQPDDGEEEVTEASEELNQDASEEESTEENKNES